MLELGKIKIPKWTELNLWVKYALIAVIIIGVAMAVWVWQDRRLAAKIEQLQIDNKVKAEQIKAIEAEKSNLQSQISNLKKQVTALQAQNDYRIEEAGRNAYQTAYDMPDNDVLDSFNQLITGARRRNSVRQ